MILQTVDLTAAGVTLGTLFGLLHPWLAVPAAIWFCIQIYEYIKGRRK